MIARFNAVVQGGQPVPARPLCHITHVRNLAGIVADGCLWSNTERKARGIQQVNIAHLHIKDRRAKKIVPVGPGGVVADYVPFYFCPRSPMLFSIHCGNVDGYEEGQQAAVHLVTATDVIAAEGLPFVFTDGHAVVAFTKFFDDLRNLERIDWAVVGSKDWADTEQDGDRKRRKQAEFLVHRFVPWEKITQIGVMDEEVGAEVERAIAAAPHRPPVRIHRQWYY